jgi:hypothetical protein
LSEFTEAVTLRSFEDFDPIGAAAFASSYTHSPFLMKREKRTETVSGPPTLATEYQTSEAEV